VRILVLSTVILCVWGEVGLTITAESDILVACTTLLTTASIALAILIRGMAIVDGNTKCYLAYMKVAFPPYLNPFFA
jgi:hypothetical protein